MKSVRIQKMSLLAASACLSLSLASFAVYAKEDGQWVQSGDRYWYSMDNGTYPANEWKLINNNWFWFDHAGWMKTGWKQLDNVWYYLRPDGIMVKGWYKVNGNWYWFSGSGAMQKGWKYINKKWYLLAPSGEMLTGWQNVNGRTFYLYPDGHMAENEVIDSIQLDKDGAALSPVTKPDQEPSPAPNPSPNPDPGKDPTQNDDPVVHACSSNVNGMDLIVTLSGTSELSDINNMYMTMIMPASYFGLPDLSGIGQDTADAIRVQIAEEQGIPKEDVTATLTAKNITVVIHITPANIREVLHMEEDASIIMSDLVSTLAGKGSICS